MTDNYRRSREEQIAALQDVMRTTSRTYPNGVTAVDISRGITPIYQEDPAACFFAAASWIASALGSKRGIPPFRAAQSTMVERAKALQLMNQNGAMTATRSEEVQAFIKEHIGLTLVRSMRTRAALVTELIDTLDEGRPAIVLTPGHWIDIYGMSTEGRIWYAMDPLPNRGYATIPGTKMAEYLHDSGILGDISQVYYAGSDHQKRFRPIPSPRSPFEPLGIVTPHFRPAR